MIAVAAAAIAFATPKPFNVITTLMLIFGLIGFGAPRPWNVILGFGLALLLIAWIVLAMAIQGPFLDAMSWTLHRFL